MSKGVYFVWITGKVPNIRLKIYCRASNSHVLMYIGGSQVDGTAFLCVTESALACAHVCKISMPCIDSKLLLETFRCGSFGNPFKVMILHSISLQY